MLARVTWRIVLSDRSPRCRRPCARCGAIRSFTSSGRFRVNANGKRIDVWLVYTCDGCGRSWNLEVLERTLVSRVPAAVHEQYQRNDVGLARRCASDVQLLQRRGAALETPPFELQVCAPEQARGAPDAALQVSIALPRAARIRLDRVLARGLSAPRGEVRALVARGDVVVIGERGDRAVRRPARHGQRVFVQR